MDRTAELERQVTHAPEAAGEIRADAAAPKKDQIVGSDKNAKGSAADKSGRITLKESTITALKTKASDHNAEMKKRARPAWTRVRVASLKAVYRRGAGAFSVSHRPGMARNQWAMARVNAFLTLASRGRPKNEKYVGDNDLLHRDHPKYSQRKALRGGRGNMDETADLERRMVSLPTEVAEETPGKFVIRGYAALYASESRPLDGFVEDIEPGAFEEILRSNPDVFGRFNHQRLLGRTSSGTMRLFSDSRGLRYEIDAPEHASDVVEMIRRGDVRGSSFAFRTSGTNEKWWKDDKGRTRRTIRKFDGLYDAGPVESPAYLGTEVYVSRRAMDQAAQMETKQEHREIGMKPTAGMAAAARRGLRLHAEGKSGDGLKPETVARANKLARREEMNEDWIREMNAWFARHESASVSQGWDTPGAEKPGFVAWLLWGGSAAKRWSKRKVAEMERTERDMDEMDDEEGDIVPGEAEDEGKMVDIDKLIAALKAAAMIAQLQQARLVS